MADTFLGRLRRGFDVFLGRADQPAQPYVYSASMAWSEARSHQRVMGQPVDKSILTTIKNRIAVDVSSYEIRHIRNDDNERYTEDIKSYLGNCLKVKANIDQTGRDFIRDAAMSLMNNGTIVIVGVETTADPERTDAYDILELRVGKAVDWRPKHVKVSLYNQEIGKREELWLDKKTVAVVENPFYAIMNEPNSTLQRLMRKLNLLDITDEKAASNKLDLIFQLPYTVRSEARKAQAQERLGDIEFQLRTSQYGIAYADANEKITQLNRPVENNLLPQIEMLTKLLYNQLGLTETIMDGTANESAMTNYFVRTVNPIVQAITEGMDHIFISKTARTQGQVLEFWRDPFMFVPISQIADIGDKFKRNDIGTSNDIRDIIGWKPLDDPKANALGNPNMPADKQVPSGDTQQVPSKEVPGNSGKDIVDILRNMKSNQQSSRER